MQVSGSFGPSVTLTGAHCTLRPLRDDERVPMARLIAEDTEASPWWSTSAATVERWLADPDALTWVIEVDGQAAGIIMASEETDPDYRHASIDITLLRPWIGRGVGRDALVTLARHLFEERRHHRITIDPAAANSRAIAAYERVGFKPVGIMRRYERAPDGQWRDGLLMDMLPEDLRNT